MSTLSERFAAVRTLLPGQVTLVAVSKTRTVDEVQALYDLGQRVFGENYPQELREKAPLLPADIEWHFIGHLQRSNVKHVVPIVHLVHGVDSERLIDEIDKRAEGLGRPVEILLQVHIAQEETKHGFSPAEIQALLQHDPTTRWPHVRIRGLMGMATNTDDTTQVQREFEGLGRLFRSIAAGAVFPPGTFSILSMGMSGDAPIAVASGSNMVRIGTALFGERPPQQHGPGTA